MSHRNYQYTVYQRRGYHVKHHVQRLNLGGFEHLFMLVDQGAKYLPKPKHLIRMFITSQLPGEIMRHICHVSAGTHDMHCIWYRVIVKYKKRG